MHIKIAVWAKSQPGLMPASMLTTWSSPTELIDPEGFSQKRIIDPKIFFPHILKSGDSSSTKVFHGEHFFDERLIDIASYRLSTNVDIWNWRNGY